jgi:uncharacterized protein YjdB
VSPIIVEASGSLSSSSSYPIASISLNSLHKTYTVGDILDVAVTFSRPISTIGSPTLTLQGRNEGNPLLLQYANVSRIQVWIRM